MVYNYLRGRLVVPLLAVVVVVVVAAVVGREAGKGGSEEEEDDEDEAAGEEEVEDMIGLATGVSVVGVNAESSEPEGCGDFGEGKDGGVDEVFKRVEAEELITADVGLSSALPGE
ncbi:hypothetical protein B9Z19DRAFT_1194891 [Tuber borchii]|uniref:Uncharacterized protein n=1 Tax=Tuber borchii TaxID=42251 RepID=A0A2T6ZLD7_TUBBO|nr:hypothetical protein B9Z19DRAFT_1194891 [Tuber borchii]